MRSEYLEALAVDDGGAALVVLLLGDPHLLEGGEGGQDGSSDPDGVLPLGGSDDLDLDGGGGKSGDLLLHSVGNTGVHGGASGHDGVGVQVLPDIDVALHDGVVGGLVDTAGLHTQEAGLEESLGTPEPLVADGDHLAVGKLVGLLEGAGRGSGGHLLLEVQGDVAQLLLDVPHDLPLGSGGEGVAPLGEDLHEVVSKVTASQVEPEDGVGKGVSLIDGNSVGDAITRVEHNTGGTARSIQGKHSLDSDIHGGGVEGLEHDLGHLLPVGLGVEGGLGKKVWCQIFSMSSQLVTIPCSMGYFRVRIPLLDWASSPTYESFWPMPTITPWWRGRPTIEGKTALGASSPAKPALHMPEPLSQTRAATSSSHILSSCEFSRGTPM